MVTVRFAPSPTGNLHVGNARMAVINYLYAKANGGQFVLRIDDTDQERSKKEYEESILADLQWLGIKWDRMEHQSARMDRYAEVIAKLKADGRLYACYETPEELNLKRKAQLAAKKPPIYDRAALNLTAEQIAAYEAEGRQAHWRFKLDDNLAMEWNDLCRGEQHFEASAMSDPVLIRADGRPLYSLPSVIDDIDFGITHIMRGEDHVTNSAMHVQLFKALGAEVPTFAHLSLLQGAEGKLSKRLGSLSLGELRKEGVEGQAIISLLARLGTPDPIEACGTLQEAVDGFDLDRFGRNTPKFFEEDLWRVNAKLVHDLPFALVEERLQAAGIEGVDESFWNVVKANIDRVADAKNWWDICHSDVETVREEDDFLAAAAALLPEEPFTDETWSAWTNAIKDETGRKGKKLFMPLRLALTGLPRGPEVKDLLPLIGRERALKRLNG